MFVGLAAPSREFGVLVLVVACPMIELGCAVFVVLMFGKVVFADALEDPDSSATPPFEQPKRANWDEIRAVAISNEFLLAIFFHRHTIIN